MNEPGVTSLKRNIKYAFPALLQYVHRSSWEAFKKSSQKFWSLLLALAWLAPRSCKSGWNWKFPAIDKQADERISEA